MDNEADQLRHTVEQVQQLNVRLECAMRAALRELDGGRGIPAMSILRDALKELDRR